MTSCLLIQHEEKSVRLSQNSFRREEKKEREREREREREKSGSHCIAVGANREKGSERERRTEMASPSPQPPPSHEEVVKLVNERLDQAVGTWFLRFALLWDVIILCFLSLSLSLSLSL